VHIKTVLGYIQILRLSNENAGASTAAFQRWSVGTIIKTTLEKPYCQLRLKSV
jgi:hypothetical protein